MRNRDLSIVIVDDLQFSRMVVKTALKKAGYDGVRLADSATQALNMLNEQPADVVLADWMMPEMDGLELTDRIRQRDEDAGTYTAIILFTASEGTDLLVKAFEHGVDDLRRSVSEIYRMLAVLVARGYVMLDEESERYSLTLRMFELSHRHPPTNRLTAVAGQVMEETIWTQNASGSTRSQPWTV